ncbi:MAG: AAA family ATPase [Pseudomonadota bacterium]|nr:hypothetical protein [Pseudomonadota bacterium]QKK06354.1 MAG: AAA family ATPase [Pseudomonadota bacterium]
MLIAIDGLDGVGKTSVIELLANEQGWINIASEVKDMRQIVRSAPKHTSAVNRLLNLAFLRHMSDTAKEFLKKGKTVLLDRYTPSHSHYAKIFNKKAIKAGEFPNIDPADLNLAKPDLVIILKVRESVRQTRLAARGEQTPHELTLSKEHKVREAIQKRLEKDADIVIDTSDLSVKETAELIKKHIEDYKNSPKKKPNTAKPRNPEV